MNSSLPKVPIPPDTMTLLKLENWVKTPTSDIKISISKETRTVTIHYKEDSLNSKDRDKKYNDGRITIIGRPPSHIYIRAIWYADNGYLKVMVTPM